MSVHWYPGHMAKARRQIESNLAKVDVVLEVRDARIPLSSANPIIEDILGNKPRVIILNKADLADPQLSKDWVDYFKSQDLLTILTVSTGGKFTKRDLNFIVEYSTTFVRKSKVTKKAMRVPRVMVVGIPNVGKSSLINALVGKRSARIGAKPGLTRGQQMINIKGQIQLLDSPGVLWPKLDDQVAACRMASTGAISSVGYPLDDIAGYIHEVLKEKGLATEETLAEYLLNFAQRRGFLLPGQLYDLERAKAVILSEFRTGKYGRFTLERPPLHHE